MSSTIIFIAVCIVSYLFGSIPVGFLVAKTRGINIKEKGSGGTGATNVARNLGTKLGVAVGVLDFFKSFLPVFFAHQLYSHDWQVMLVSILPVVGHIFPVWLLFNGGKGVATIFGLLAGFFGLIPFLVFLVIWYLVVKVVKLMSLVNLIVGLLLPLVFWVQFRALSYSLFGIGLGLIIWWRHRENIQRLLNGSENRINL